MSRKWICFGYPPLRGATCYLYIYLWLSDFCGKTKAKNGDPKADIIFSIWTERLTLSLIVALGANEGLHSAALGIYPMSQINLRGNIMKYILVIALGIITASSAFAHSGGTNKDGCHAGSKPYHCH